MDLNYIKTKMKDKGYTQAKLSRQMDLSEAIVCDWIKGKKNPKVSTLIKLCKLLDLDANILLGLKK